MKKQVMRPKSIKNKMIILLAFHQIDFDWVVKLSPECGEKKNFRIFQGSAIISDKSIAY